MPLGTASVSAQEYTLRPRRLAINKAKAELETALAAAEKDNKNLASKFAKYDIALWGMQNPEAAEKTINREGSP